MQENTNTKEANNKIKNLFEEVPYQCWRGSQLWLHCKTTFKIIGHRLFRIISQIPILYTLLFVKSANILSLWKKTLSHHIGLKACTQSLLTQTFPRAECWPASWFPPVVPHLCSVPLNDWNNSSTVFIVHSLSGQNYTTDDNVLKPIHIKQTKFCLF